MQVSPSYAKPPIIEALIDLQVKRSSEIPLSTLRNLQSSIEPDYPLCQEIMTLTGEIQGGSSIAATASQNPIGYRFSSSDTKQIFQARLDGFTFSQLAPYKCWESFRGEIQRLWNIYQWATNPTNIVRVAVRYINRLDLPLPLNDFKDYLRTVPQVSPDLPQGLSDYIMQLQMPQQDLEGMLLLNEAIIPSSGDNIVSVLLDIELSCIVNFSSDENTLWNLLERLRVRKNEVFEACITDKTRRLIQ